MGFLVTMHRINNLYNCTFLFYVEPCVSSIRNIFELV